MKFELMQQRHTAFPALLCTLLVIILCNLPIQAAAQYAGVIPQGVLGVIGGFRSYGTQDETWDSNGRRIPLSTKAQLRFDGDHLMRGEGGAKLRSLAEELKRYDAASDTPDSLVRRLDLGTLSVGGSARMNVQMFGLALGLPKNQTIYAVAPVVDLQINTTFRLSGINNASALRDELGSVAFDELRAGLAEASQLTDADIKASIEAAQYTGVESWRYRNLADVIFGYAADVIPPAADGMPAVPLTLQAEVFATAPTGHTDNPDVLSDVSTGTGSWGFGFGLSPRLSIAEMTFGAETNATAYLPSRLMMRIPVSDETIISASRKTSVMVRTGINWEFTALAEKKFDWFQPQYRFSVKRHERDSITGGLEGNYNLLMDATVTTKIEHALWLYFSSVEAFRKKDFPLPLRVKLAANQILKGFNTTNDPLIEIQILGFLPTPLMPE